MYYCGLGFTVKITFFFKQDVIGSGIASEIKL